MSWPPWKMGIFFQFLENMVIWYFPIFFLNLRFQLFNFCYIFFIFVIFRKGVCNNVIYLPLENLLIISINDGLVSKKERKKNHQLHAWLLVFDKISFPINFILPFLAGIFFRSLHANFYYNHFFELHKQISLRKKTYKVWSFGIFQRKFKHSIFFQNTLKIQCMRYFDHFFALSP